MYEKHRHMTKSITFIQETTQCVFTRDNNPMYALKNVMHVSLQVNSGGAIPTMRRAVEGENFITKNNDLDFIYIDMPASQVPSVRKALTKVSSENSSAHRTGMPGTVAEGAPRTFPGKQ